MTDNAGELHRLPDGREKLTAHDIRHLATCAICGGLADRRTSISYKAAFGYEAKDPHAVWHPKCCFEHHGTEFVRNLPRAEQGKFCLSDIPASLMRDLLEMS